MLKEIENFIEKKRITYVKILNHKNIEKIYNLLIKNFIL